MIFNICSEVPSCEWPVDIALADLQPTSATFSWQGSGIGYETALGEPGFNPDTVASLAGIHQTTTSTSITYAGLNSNSNYDFYVRSYCSTGDTSEWSYVYSFRTPCTASSLPYTEGFESYSSGSATPSPATAASTSMLIIRRQPPRLLTTVTSLCLSST